LHCLDFALFQQSRKSQYIALHKKTGKLLHRNIGDLTLKLSRFLSGLPTRGYPQQQNDWPTVPGSAASSHTFRGDWLQMTEVQAKTAREQVQ